MTASGLQFILIKRGKGAVCRRWKDVVYARDLSALRDRVDTFAHRAALVSSLRPYGLALRYAIGDK